MILILIILTIIHAFIDSKFIKGGKRIYHGWEGLIYAATASSLCLWFVWWRVAIGAVLVRAVFFDPALNLFRGLPIMYNGQGGSIIDRIENKLNPMVLRIIYVVLFAAFLVSCDKVEIVNPPKQGLEDSIIITKNGTRLLGRGDTIKYLKVYNASDVYIDNVVVQSGGIHIYTDSIMKDIRLNKVVSFGANIGLALWSEGGGYIDGFRVQDSRFFDNSDAGIYAWGEWPYIRNKNISIHNVDAYDNYGIEGKRPHTGNGIVIAGFDRGTISNCRAWNNGYKYGTGNIGIWCYDSKNLTFEGNESFENKSTTGTDGGGMDIDGGCENITMRNNTTRDNDGAGYLLYEYGSPNPMINNRFIKNISINDGRNGRAYSNFSIGGMPGTSVQGVLIDSNVVATLPGKNPVTYFNEKALSGVVISNNSWQ